MALGSSYENPGAIFYAFANHVPDTVPFHRWVSGMQQYCVKVWGQLQESGYPLLHQRTIEASTYAEAKIIGTQIKLEYSSAYHFDVNARKVIETWRQEYNEERPHSSLNDLTPKEFSDKFLTADPTSNPC